MDLNLQGMSESILSQIAFVVLIIMAFRAIAAYVRQDWGQFLGGIVMGLLCLIIVIFGPQLQNLAESIGGNIFGTVYMPQITSMINGVIR
ncbi:hypothetical protein K2V74_14585 [Mammaliicoccus sciuri]|uniref:hypothetical protein n=1 Tax=Mammaliicoccus sciuri TaxID=1296 RepID=UPI0005E42909|nr:hypothetical protein [Mammaliicoccus sciuri]MCD8875544.1 hypothetical protein [Mammaliicoccus sciuri]MCE5086347.1 hypothetical protein [Mammaliicoccus sciuri]CPQ83750.1 Uncharacterised protein [Staphylococcus aureus]